MNWDTIEGNNFAPYLAFLPAEALHVSGVLAVVVTGLWMAHVSPRVQTASSRIARRVMQTLAAHRG